MTFQLETERLLLRPLQRSDADALVDLDADPAVRRYVDMPGAPTLWDVHRALDRMLACAAPGLGFFAAIEKVSRDFIGWFHLRRDGGTVAGVELGYRLRREVWGQGYATEGAIALIEHGIREQGVRRVTGTALADNAASRRVMEKCGMTFRESFHYKGVPAVRYVLEIFEAALRA